MKKALTALILLTLIAAVFAGCTRRTDAAGQVSGELTDEVFFTQTPYCRLAYPVRWQDAVAISTEDQDAVKFALAKDKTPLFDILFGDGDADGALFGTMIRDEGNVVIRTRNYDADQEHEAYDQICAMQKDLNVILHALLSDYDIAINEIVPDEDNSVFAIETDVAVLYYPAKWKDMVTVDVSDTTVRFSYGEYEVFDLLFSGEDGYLLGAYGETPIRIITYDVDEGVLSQEEYDNFYAMQQNVNVILQHLMEDSNFTMNG